MLRGIGPFRELGEIKEKARNMIRIFVVDDHPIIRKALRSLLENESDIHICGEAATAQEALESLPQANPDLVLVDISLPELGGIELVRILRIRNPGLPAAILSGHRDGFVKQALDAGANGYILKGNSDDLPEAIRQIVKGKQYLSPEISV